MYLWVPHVLKLLLSTPTGDVKTLIYELSYMYTMIEDHYMWSYMALFGVAMKKSAIYKSAFNKLWL